MLLVGSMIINQIDLGPRRIFKMGKDENIEDQGEKTSKVLAHQRQLDGFDLLSMF